MIIIGLNTVKNRNYLVILIISLCFSFETIYSAENEIAICRTQLSNKVFFCVTNGTSRCTIKIGLKVDPIPCETSICADNTPPPAIESDNKPSIIDILTGKRK